MCTTAEFFAGNDNCFMALGVPAPGTCDERPKKGVKVLAQTRSYVERLLDGTGAIY